MKLIKCSKDFSRLQHHLHCIEYIGRMCIYGVGRVLCLNYIYYIHVVELRTSGSRGPSFCYFEFSTNVIRIYRFVWVVTWWFSGYKPEKPPEWKDWLLCYPENAILLESINRGNCVILQSPANDLSGLLCDGDRARI